MSHDVFWSILTLVSLFVTLVFAWEEVRAIRFRRTHDEPIAEHGLVVAGVLTVIAAGTLSVGWGQVIDSQAMRDLGSVLIRGAMVPLAVYFLASGPVRRASR